MSGFFRYTLYIEMFHFEYYFPSPICYDWCVTPKKILNISFPFQVRTSYLPNEILWGHQFDHNVLIYDKKMGSYQVHHSRVNKTLLDDTPRVSARQLHMRSKRNSSGLSNSTSTDHSPSKKPFKKQSSTTAWHLCSAYSMACLLPLVWPDVQKSGKNLILESKFW